MPAHRGTMEAARLLETSYWRLIGLLRANKMPPPPKDANGDYQWSDEDIARARAALRPKPKQPI